MISVAIFLYPDIELLDFAGPFEVFTTANRVATKMGSDFPGFSVFSVAETKDPVRTRAGVTILPDFSCTEHPPCDLLVVPGGVIDAELNNRVTISWIARTAASAQIAASVCTGVFLLAQAGVITEDEVTTHWEDIEDLRQRFPGLTVTGNRRWVDRGKIVTSAGISAGIDMSLHLVERCSNHQLARQTAHQMEFDWQK